MANARCGISAEQMERELGVTYKQAHKMMKRIRMLVGDDGESLKGDVQVDETSWGGKPRNARGDTRFRAVEQPTRHEDGIAPAAAKPTILGRSSAAAACVSV